MHHADDFRIHPRGQSNGRGQPNDFAVDVLHFGRLATLQILLEREDNRLAVEFSAGAEANSAANCRPAHHPREPPDAAQARHAGNRLQRYAGTGKHAATFGDDRQGHRLAPGAMA